MIYILLGIVAVVAFLIFAVVFAAAVALVIAIARSVEMVAAIICEERELRRDRVTAQARDRWRGAWRRYW
jgi:hypothetical protein